MKRCTSCQRHLMVHESGCPFCGASQGPLPRAPGVAWVLALGLATASCADPLTPVDDHDGGSSNADDSTSTQGATSASSITATSTTAPSTTVVDDTMDPSGDSMASDTLETSFVFYGAPDAGPSIECDLYAQDCPPGDKCMPWANDGGPTHNATRCSPVDPEPNSVGDPCIVEGSALSGIDSCVLGAMCMGVDPMTNEGTCVELCGGTPGSGTCQAPGVECTPLSDLPIPLCLVACDPMASQCPAGFTCSASGEVFACVPAL
jgi:hypothetical protein